MGRAGNLSNLIENARKYGDSSASNGRWQARLEYFPSVGKNWITVRHHATDMIRITDTNAVLPLSEGWRSQTDKQGINRILAGAGIWSTYGELFPEEERYLKVSLCAVEGCPNIAGKDSTRCADHVSKPPTTIKRWHPPLRVEDTMF